MATTKPVAKPVVQNNTKAIPQKPVAKPTAKVAQVKKK